MDELIARLDALASKLDDMIERTTARIEECDRMVARLADV
jgi:hypothetical protein